MFTELVRLGKDAELKTTQSGDLLSLYAAYDVGFGDKKKTQWIGLTLFGKRAVKWWRRRCTPSPRRRR
jgi:single-stranded DNA-binding protein